MKLDINHHHNLPDLVHYLGPEQHIFLFHSILLTSWHWFLFDQINLHIIHPCYLRPLSCFPFIHIYIYSSFSHYAFHFSFSLVQDNFCHLQNFSHMRVHISHFIQCRHFTNAPLDIWLCSSNVCTALLGSKLYLNCTCRSQTAVNSICNFLWTCVFVNCVSVQCIIAFFIIITFLPYFSNSRHLRSHPLSRNITKRPAIVSLVFFFFLILTQNALQMFVSNNIFSKS